MFHPDTGDYEFSDQQNSVIRKLFTGMTIFGSFSLAWSMLLFKRSFDLYGILEKMPEAVYQNSLNKAEVSSAAFQSLLGALVPLLFGIFFIKAAGNFRNIVKTKGNDIPNLMDALSSLNNVYTVAMIFSVILLALLVLNILGVTALT